MEYKNTIITPKTDFPMKAGLPQREPGMLARWEELDLYNAMLEKNKDLPPFILHDGPPFSNGYIHMGHALNKTLKDFIVRSQAMMGHYTPYVPGWAELVEPSNIVSNIQQGGDVVANLEFATALYINPTDFTGDGVLYVMSFEILEGASGETELSLVSNIGDNTNQNLEDVIFALEGCTVNLG